MKKYNKIEVEGEVVYLRKTFLGWGVIHPAKIDNKTNWKNFLIGGSWIKFFILIGIILIILGCLSEYSNAVNVANECLNSLSKEGIVWLP